MGNEVTRKDIDALQKQITAFAGNCNNSIKTTADALRKQMEANDAIGSKNAGAHRDYIQKLDDRVGRLEENVKWLMGAVEALQKK